MLIEVPAGYPIPLSLGSSAHLAKWDLVFSVYKVGKIVATSHGWCQNLVDPAWGLHPKGVRLLLTGGSW